MGYLFAIDNFYGIFGTGLIFKSLEAVVASEEVAEGNMILKLLSEGSAELGNTFSELVPEVEGTQKQSHYRPEQAMRVPGG